MGKEYSEVVLDGPMRLLKGFVHGYFLGIGREDRPFFHLKSGTIRHDTLIGSLRTFFEMENLVPFCIDNELLDGFKDAMDHAERRFGVSIKSINPIESVEFDFKHHIHSADLAEDCKSTFSQISDTIELLDYEPFEAEYKNAPPVSWKSDSHNYEYRGMGKVKGSFKEVTNFFFIIKRSRCSEFVEIKQITLNFK